MTTIALPTHRQHRPLAPFIALVVIGAMVVASLQALDWNIEALTSSAARAKAFERLASFLAGFASPDISDAWLATSWELAYETLTVAFLGASGGMVFGYGLSLFASRSVMSPGRGWSIGRVICACARIVLDILRAVPDFVWAVMLIPLIGLGAQTGALAIAISVTGILGKIYSELWDNVDPRRYQAAAASGAGRIGVFFFGIQPLAGRQALSFTLMRTECAVRNASVIGVVGAGGIGAEIFEQLKYAEFGKVTTLLFFMLALTIGVDLLSNLLRRQLRNDPNHPKTTRGLSPAAQLMRTYGALAVVIGIIAWCVAVLWSPGEGRGGLETFGGLFSGERWDKVTQLFGGLLHPDLSWKTVSGALASASYPLALAVIGTLIGVVLAALFAYAHSVTFQIDSHRFSGERPSFSTRLWRWTLAAIARICAVTARGVPEIAWALIFVFFFTIGPLPGALAIGIHSFGVLVRVFTESIDNLPYRTLERAYTGSRQTTFTNAAMPMVWREWATYSFFQFESNVRAGVVLGLVGLGGLGFSFYSNFQWFMFEQASTYLIVIILLTMIIDRISRALKLGRA
ncbi:MAG: ABC transporter permease subunit [Planctomycetes bacterium]|nr:ABC transporter permease subunit [Planctomycetota bacterium]